MFLLITIKKQWKTTDFAKTMSNLSLNFENLGPAIFKEHFSVSGCFRNEEFPL